MRVRLCFGHWLPRILGVRAIVIYPRIYFADEKAIVARDWRLLRHEFVHIRQVRTLGWWRFYFRYLREYAHHLRKTHHHWLAYRAISFENEAYQQEHSLKFSQHELEILQTYDIAPNPDRGSSPLA